MTFSLEALVSQKFTDRIERSDMITDNFESGEQGHR